MISNRIFLVSTDPQNFINNPKQAQVLNSLLAHKNSRRKIMSVVLTNLQSQLKRVILLKFCNLDLKIRNIEQLLEQTFTILDGLMDRYLLNLLLLESNIIHSCHFLIPPVMWSVKTSRSTFFPAFVRGKTTVHC